MWSDAYHYRTVEWGEPFVANGGTLTFISRLPVVASSATVSLPIHPFGSAGRWYRSQQTISAETDALANSPLFFFFFKFPIQNPTLSLQTDELELCVQCPCQCDANVCLPRRYGLAIDGPSGGGKKNCATSAVDPNRRVAVAQAALARLRRRRLQPLLPPRPRAVSTASIRASTACTRAWVNLWHPWLNLTGKKNKMAVYLIIT